jgi:hypothetical protein
MKVVLKAIIGLIVIAFLASFVLLLGPGCAGPELAEVRAYFNDAPQDFDLIRRAVVPHPDYDEATQAAIRRLMDEYLARTRAVAEIVGAGAGGEVVKPTPEDLR